MPPTRLPSSKTVTSNPAASRYLAAQMPAAPAPITATRADPRRCGPATGASRPRWNTDWTSVIAVSVGWTGGGLLAGRLAWQGLRLRGRGTGVQRRDIDRRRGEVGRGFRGFAGDTGIPWHPDRIVGHDAGLLAGDHQHMQADRQRQLVRLGDGNEVPVRLLDDVFPALGVGCGLLGRGADQAAHQRAADRAERRGEAAARRLRP